MADLVVPPVRRQLFGMQLDALCVDDAVGLAKEAVRTRQRLLIGVVNAAKVVHLRSDELLRESLLECDVLLADGQSVVWASRLLGQSLPERIAGIDLFEQLLTLADREHRSVYLLGATPGVLAAVEQVISSRWPGIGIAGSHDGYFEASDSGQIAEDIASSGADMLFLGMSSPKKEIFMATYGPLLRVPVQHGVGGSFDVLGGLTKRAPTQWQRWGLEWLYRVLQEPGRLWRRYLTTNTVFVLLLVRERFRRSPVYVSSINVSEETTHE